MIKLRHKSGLSNNKLLIHYFKIKLLAIVGECIEVYSQFRNKVNKGVNTPFGLKKFIKYHHFFRLENAIAALKVSPFVTDHIPAFFYNSFYFIQCGLRVFHLSAFCYNRNLHPFSVKSKKGFQQSLINCSIYRKSGKKYC
mgnify:CR=1 FL=1